MKEDKLKMRYLFGLVLIILFLSACKNERQEKITYQEGEGGRIYGGIFRLNESEYIKNLFPHNITDAYSYRVASQVYEGLFKFDPANLSVNKCLVEDYQIDASRTVYTFNLKENIFFHDDPCFENGKGRNLTAQDVAYSFTKLCTQSPNNQSFSTIFKGYLKGADEFYQASASSQNDLPESVEGITVVDKYTLQLELTKPNAIFLIHLARPACFIFPREAYEAYGNDMRIKAVGTGPFYLDQVDENISLTLKKNPVYHGVDQFGNRLPFLDALQINFMSEKKTELFEFKKGNLDMIYRLPTEHIIEILEETAANENGELNNYQLQRVPELVSQILVLNTKKEVFRDKRVRKAINFAIDRSKILDFVLNGEGYAPGNHGITPPSFDNYPINDIEGYTLNIDSARYYLSEAGYPNGNNFPEIELLLNAEGERNTLVAVEIQKELKDHLNIDLKLTILPFAQSIERSFQGNFDMIKVAWYADFPSPENFLWLFHGAEVPDELSESSYPNIARYRNSQFDQYYQQAMTANNIKTAHQYFKNAEKQLMDDAPLVVLWYDEGYRLVKNHVKNFPNNPMQYRDFSEVYISPSDSLK